TSLYLEPLPDEAMRDLLTGLVPGLPANLTEQILARAEGVPLYAVETVRMLLDRGLLVQQESVYRPTGEIGELDVPETLHALIAARLDGLSTDERRGAQGGAVLGKTFTRAAPTAPDAADIKEWACRALTQAGERAASLAAAAEAQSYFEQAAELSADALAEAALTDRAGQMARRAGAMAEARALLDRAHDA